MKTKKRVARPLAYLLSALIGFGVSAGLARIVSGILENVAGYENHVLWVSFVISAAGGTASALAAKLIFGLSGPLDALASASLCAALYFGLGLGVFGPLAPAWQVALRAALTALTAPAVFLIAGGVKSKRPRRRRRR